MKYQHFNFSKDRLALIEKINNIIQEFADQGIHHLSVRQIFYQLVAADEIKNSDATYNQVGGAVSDGRMAGLVSWDSIVDRNRTLRGTNTVEDIPEAMKGMRRDYSLDKWHDQEWRPVVLVEKAALEGVIGSICNALQVDFMALRGYNSMSESWSLGQRFAQYYRMGQRPIVFHLGDHDPSGLDMTRDNRERLALFCGTPVIVQRLALNMNQIKQYDPPPNMAKSRDPRYEDYRRLYGEDSWELDALNPLVIQKLISDAILLIRDEAKWDANLSREVDDLRAIDDMIAEAGGATDEEDQDDE